LGAILSVGFGVRSLGKDAVTTIRRGAMIFLSKLLRILQQKVALPSDLDSERARSKRTEQVLERYDAMLNASRSRRQRTPSGDGRERADG
jgi:hypothetical protein